MSERLDIFAKVAERIVAALEGAQADLEAGHTWQFPWVQTAATANGNPISLQGRAYRGGNWFVLSLLRGCYPSQLFGTYRGWQERGAQVRKGEKGIPVFFWKRLLVNARDGEEGDENGRRHILFAKGFTVFAAEQVDGFDLAAYLAKAKASLPNAAQLHAAADKLASDYLEREHIGIEWGGGRACYSPALDRVAMPNREAFKSTAGLYSTLLHELGHSTGHERRLKRDLGKRFGSEAYAAEELVAELCAAMCCAALGIETATREDHGRYIAGWLRAIKSDPKAVVTAASHAQRAADLILGTPALSDSEEPTNGEEVQS